MNWKELVKNTADKVSTPRLASKISNSHFENKGSLTLYGFA